MSTCQTFNPLMGEPEEGKTGSKETLNKRFIPQQVKGMLK